MMEAKELRIGNYVRLMLNHSDFNEFPIELPDFNLIANNSRNHTYEPIPLTEEWLVKFGFTKHDKGWFWKNWGKNGTVIVVWMEPYKKYGIQLGQHKTKVVDYVHELQNGFNFLASGEELTLNNK